MNTYNNEIAGGEFDWFAKDIEGNIGLFATAGEGTVPDIVVSNYEEHSKIIESIESPNWGSEDVWSDYASMGLYVYDWSLPGGPYKLMKSPTSEMSRKLQSQIKSLSSLYVLKIKYSDNQTIENL